MTAYDHIENADTGTIHLVAQDAPKRTLCGKRLKTFTVGEEQPAGAWATCGGCRRRMKLTRPAGSETVRRGGRILLYTNPSETPGGGWRCPVCKGIYDDEPSARQCAERDHARKAAR
jgi:ssDNA-binding Zn-finger/Zn-ribbon topoisomerase 1